MCKNAFKPSGTQARLQAAALEQTLAQQRAALQEQVRATQAQTAEARRQFEDQQRQLAMRAAEDLGKVKEVQTREAAAAASGMTGMRSLLSGRRGGGGFSARAMLGMGG